MFCPSCSQRHCLKFSHLPLYLLPLISDIITLGHPSPRILHLLVKNKKVSYTSTQFNVNCHACPLGKSSRLTLKTTGHQTRAPLDLIFIDVWGPSSMLSSDGFCYFVIFVDAHTKFIWFYHLVAKSDVFTIFHQFQVLVKL